MLGAIGFSFAALLFAGYALSARSNAHVDGFRISSYVAAYLLLALACASWAFAALIGGHALVAGVLLGDAFVMIGTVCMIDAVSGTKFRLLALMGSSLVAAVAFTARVQYFAPHPYQKDSVLVFNSGRTVAIVFLVFFTVVWFPVTMRFVSRVLQGSGLIYLGKAGILACVLAVLGVYGFLSAKTTTEIIIYFVVLCCAFATLIGIDTMSRKVADNG